MVDVLALGSHPDDIEFGCGGVLAKMAVQGHSIVMADLTLGEMGTNGTPKIRRKESLEAARVIGAERIFLDFKDCQIHDTHEGRLKLVEVIRTYQPKLVLAPHWKGEQNHPDHLATGLMARYACRYARFKKILPDLPIYTPGGILHYVPPAFDQADFLVDVSDYVELWEQMMRCHKSQLQTFPFVDWVLKQAAKLGMLMGATHAQGFLKGNPIVVDNLLSVARGTREI